jgi:putative FmdB family regulatory protein
MPLYEYECDACGHRFEVIQKFSDPPAETCTSCGRGPVHRLPSSPAIQFKGSGWYITDYAQKGKSGSGAETGEKSEKTEKTDKAEGKTEKKSDTTPASTSTPSSPAKT